MADNTVPMYPRRRAAFAQEVAAGRSMLRCAVGSVLAIATLVSATVAQSTSFCGNGIVEPGEQCDVANTPSGADECDGCAADCTLSEECGLAACQDGIDNDGNGLADAADPGCATLWELQGLAIVANDSSRGTVRLRRGARVATASGRDAGVSAPYPVGASQAGICGSGILVDGLATLGGSVTSTGTLQFAQHDAAGIAAEVVLTNPALLRVGVQPPFVGDPVGTCLGSATSCLTALDCPGNGECTGRSALGPGNPWVDLDGTKSGAAALQTCRSALVRLRELVEPILPMEADATALDVSGSVRMQTVHVNSGLNVIGYTAVHLGTRAVLSIDGPADAIVVFQVEGPIELASTARVVLGGGVTAQNVLWNVIGYHPMEVVLGTEAEFTGTILAPEREVRLKRMAVLHGAAYARRVTLQPYARLEHVPFVALLPVHPSVLRIVEGVP